MAEATTYMAVLGKFGQGFVQLKCQNNDDDNDEGITISVFV